MSLPGMLAAQSITQDSPDHPLYWLALADRGSVLAGGFTMALIIPFFLMISGFERTCHLECLLPVSSTLYFLSFFVCTRTRSFISKVRHDLKSCSSIHRGAQLGKHTPRQCIKRCLQSNFKINSWVSNESRTGDKPFREKNFNMQTCFYLNALNSVGGYVSTASYRTLLIGGTCISCLFS